MRIATTTRPPTRAWRGAWAARTACVVGLLYACVNTYWGAGGTRLLDTVGGSLARLGHAHDTTLIVAIWGTVALKVAAALLPLLALRSAPDGPRKITRVLAWVAAAIRTVYGAVLTTVGLLVQADVIRSPASADRRALMWHAHLWDPWFLLWGLLIATALLRSKTLRPPIQVHARV